MRGTKSLEKNDNALYVIDGIPMFNVNSGDNAGGTMNKQPGSNSCLLYTSPSPRDRQKSRMPSSA